ncbi:MAG: TetR/AcrR family transcriptional regulator [Actinobacteria bacterium]|nr:TetR/AcrR family transcriptional regulator [Actinomycetota bacterium]
MPEAMLRSLVPGRRGEILDAAIEVFGECGYENGSMREIAAAVGVSEPALYRHFSSKEDIFLTMITAAAEQLRVQNFALVEPLNPSSLRQILISVFRARRHAIASYSRILRTVLAASAHHPQFLVAYRESIALPMQQALSAKVHELDAAFGLDFTEEQTVSRVRALLSMLVGYVVTSAVLADESDAAIADAVLRLLDYPTA